MTKHISLFALAGALIITFALLVVVISSRQVQASAPSGLQANVSTTTAKLLPAEVAETLIATTTNCAARIITTQAGNGVRLTFSDYIAETPSLTVGTYQLGSTTVAYDAGIYGCGRVKAVGAAQTVYIIETR